MADPALQIRGSGEGGEQGGGHPDPEIRGLFGLKIKAGAGPQAPPLDSPLFFFLTFVSSLHSFGIISHHKRNDRPFQGIFFSFSFFFLSSGTNKSGKIRKFR